MRGVMLGHHSPNGPCLVLPHSIAAGKSHLEH